MADNDVKIKVSLDGADQTQKGLNGIGDAASDADSKTGKFGAGLKGVGTAVMGFATVAAAAGGALVAGVTSQYAQYEQLVGGVEKLFGNSASQVQAYAADAYKTAGLSANEYMSQVTSFSAALISGLGGDTAAATEIANNAITDMSDNAAVFGSSIGDIQNAYQGFAKQNFTMLDNLKLGYGGTAAEMARLVNDAGLMEEGFVATAENINSVSYDQIIESIGAIQDQMGITGTTAREASQTISGSIDMLRGSFANLLTGLGSADADVATLAGNVITSLETVLTNITPVIENIGANIATLGPRLGDMTQTLVGALAAAIPTILQAGVALVGGLITGLTTALPQLITALVPGIIGLVETLATLAPMLITAGAEAVVALATGLAEAAPTLIPAIIAGLLGMVQALIAAAPMLIDAGLQLIMGLAQGLMAALPTLIAALPVLIQGLVTFFVTAIPQIIQAGVTLLTSLIGALPQIITTIVAALPQIITSVITAILGAIPLLINAGIQLLVSLVENLPAIINGIVSAIPTIITSVINAIVGAIPQLISAGVRLLVALVQNMPAILGGIIGAIPQIISGIVNGIVGAIPEMARVGLQLIQGLWRGISDAAGWLMGKIGGFVDQVMGGIKDFFGIASPSKRMEFEVGVELPAGLGEGVERNEDAAIKPIQDLNTKMMDEALKLNTTMAFTHDTSLTQTMVPMQVTPQRQGPINVEATLDPYLIGEAIGEAFTANERTQTQAPVALTRESARMLASEIVDAMRVQSRQGVVSLG